MALSSGQAVVRQSNKGKQAAARSVTIPDGRRMHNNLSNRAAER